ncbi:hypothetical protein LEP1GSC170_3599 [Leptospira interrogans serovar Bataviae str. HAI135]|nr:hypothetical protein LEP1GSC170_3599 [Leptospira interrogans serovar Bataviae str. HAI135]
MASAETHDSKLIFPTLKKFKVFRNKKLLKPDILSLDKAYASKTIKSNLKRRIFNTGSQTKRMQKILYSFLN